MHAIDAFLGIFTCKLPASGMSIVYLAIKTIRETDRYFTQTLSPTILLLLSIYYLPLVARKFLLTACRLQVSYLRNRFLQEEYNKLVLISPFIHLPDHIRNIYLENGIIRSHNHVNGQVDRSQDVPIEIIMSLYLQLYDSPACCGIISYFTRGESTRFPEEFSLAGLEGIIKEINASQHINVDQRVDYGVLFTPEIRTMHTEVDKPPYATKRLFRRHLKQVIEDMQKETHIILGKCMILLLYLYRTITMTTCLPSKTRIMSLNTQKKELS